MSGVVRRMPAEVQTYVDQMRAYHLRLAEWLGLDPDVLFRIDEADAVPAAVVPGGMPGGVNVTWKAFEDGQVAGEHLGRYELPWSMSSDGEQTTFSRGVHLDWREEERLRAEVGERPAFPAPAGGWPKGWPAL